MMILVGYIFWVVCARHILNAWIQWILTQKLYSWNLPASFYKRGSWGTGFTSCLGPPLVGGEAGSWIHSLDMECVMWSWILHGLASLTRQSFPKRNSILSVHGCFYSIFFMSLQPVVTLAQNSLDWHLGCPRLLLKALYQQGTRMKMSWAVYGGNSYGR